MARLTVKDLLACKGGKKLTMINVSDHDTAQACDRAGIDMLSCSGASLPQVRKGAPNCFIRPAAPRPSYKASDADAIRACYALMEQGADAVYMCPGLDRIRAVAKMRIPVFGHVGLVPDHLTWIGGYRSVGKTAQEALRVYQDVLAHQEAGAIGVEMEVVPHRIAAEISKRVEISVIGLGSGPGCDGEMLFACDVLGSHGGHYPRHAKKYRNHFEDSVEAFKEFKQEVDNRSFPAKQNIVAIKDEEFEKFMEEID